MIKTKAKTALIILGTLAIGIVIGSLASGTLRQEREQTFSRMMLRQRFLSVMQRILQPTEEQRKAINEILVKRSEQISTVQETFQDEIFAIYDSLRTDLQAFLTEEQTNRLEAELAKGSDKVLDIRMAHMTEALDLNRMQQDQLRQVMKSVMPPRLSGRDNFQFDREERRKRFQQFRQEIERILTPDQLRKFRQMRYDRRPPFERAFGGPRRHRNFRNPRPDRDFTN